MIEEELLEALFRPPSSRLDEPRCLDGHRCPYAVRWATPATPAELARIEALARLGGDV